MKKLFIALLALMALMLMLPQICFDACADAFGAWYSVVLPSLFPFMAACTLLKKLGCFESVRLPFMGIFGLPGETGMAVALGAVAGYPNGARLSGGLGLAPRQTLTLLVLCNMAGPMFLTGSVALGMLGNATLGAYMIGAQAVACVFVALLLAQGQACKVKLPQAQEKTSFGTALYSAVTESLGALMGVGGLMAVFACIFAVLDYTGAIGYAAKALCLLGIDEQLSRALMSASLEMTMGCRAISTLPISLAARAALCCGATTFGGACIAMQTVAFAEVSPMSYMGAKLCCGAFAGVLCYIALSGNPAVLICSVFAVAACGLLIRLAFGITKRAVKSAHVDNN